MIRGADAGEEDSEVAAMASAVAAAVQNLDQVLLIIARTTNPALRGVRDEATRVHNAARALQRTVNHIPGA